MTIPTDHSDITLVASRQSARQQNLPIPTGFSPEGVEVTCADPATLHLTEHALPPKYRDLLAHLLLSATRDPKTTTHLSLFLAAGEANNEAILLIASQGIGESLATRKGDHTTKIPVVSLECVASKSPCQTVWQDILLPVLPQFALPRTILIHRGRISSHGF
jgi:hypothetical protein